MKKYSISDRSSCIILQLAVQVNRGIKKAELESLKKTRS
jgi:hypothetical protein